MNTNIFFWKQFTEILTFFLLAAYFYYLCRQFLLFLKRHSFTVVISLWVGYIYLCPSEVSYFILGKIILPLSGQTEKIDISCLSFNKDQYFINEIMDENYCEAFENIYIPLQHPSKFWVGRAVVIYTQACLLFQCSSK